MPVTSDKNLTLGVLFTGKVHPTFTAAVGKLRTALGDVTGATKKSAQATKGGVKPTRDLANENSLLGKRIGQVSGGFQRLTNAMRVTAAYGIAATAIFGVINAMRSGVTQIFDYDQALKNLQAITGATDAEIGALGIQIKRVAADTKYSAGEVAEATILLGQAGFTAAESLEAIGAVANLATGTLSNMKDVADLMTTAIRAFGLQASEATQVADYFAVAVNKSKLTIDKLRTAFNYLGPIAKQADLSLRETAAGAMILANAGFKASTIGTGFRQVIARLVAPSEKLKTIFKATGVELDKINPAANDFKSVIGELNKILGEGITQTERARRAFALFGLRGASAASAFAQAGVAGFEQMYEWLGKVGAASDMAKKQIEGLGVMAKNLKDKLGLLAVAVGEGGIAGTFRALLNIIRPLVDVLIYLAGTLGGKLTVGFVTLTLVMLGASTVVKYLLIQFTALVHGYTIATVKTMAAAHAQNVWTVSMNASVTALRTLKVAILSHPFYAMAAGIGLVIAAFFTLRRHIREQRKELGEHAILLNSQRIALETYRDRLKKVSGSEEEHRSIMRQLLEEYPELASSIDLLTMRFNDQGEALKELIKQKKLLHVQDKLAVIAMVQQSQASYEGLRARAKEFQIVRLIYKLYEDNLGRTKKSIELQEEFTLAVREGAMALKDVGITAGSSLGTIAETIAFITGRTDDLEILARTIKSILMAEPIAVPGAKLIKLIEGLPKEWREYYKTLDMYRKNDLLLHYFATLRKAENLSDSMTKIGTIESDQQIHIEKLKERELQRFIDTDEKKVRTRKAFLDQITSLEIKSMSNILRRDEALEKLKADQLKQRLQTENMAYFNRTQDLEGWGREDTRINEVYNSQVEAIDKKYTEKRKEAKRKFLQEMEILGVKYLKDQREYQKIQAKHELDDEIAKYEKLRQEGEISEIEKGGAIARARKAYRDRLLKIDADYDKKDEKEERKTIRRSLRNMEYAYAQRKITLEEYLAFLKDAREHDLISERDYTNKVTQLHGGMWAKFKQGIQESVIEMRIAGSAFTQIGRGLVDTISSSMTNSLLDYTEGVKTAEEAWQDFGRSVLRWLGEIIIKQTILNALQATGEFFSPTTTMTTTLVGGPVGHKGGIVGLGDLTKYHSGGIPGLRQNEYPVIVQEGEGIFTKEQMNALGGPRSVQVNITNKSGVPLEGSMEQEPQIDLSSMILNIVLDGANRNKGGFKNTLKGALSG